MEKLYSHMLMIPCFQNRKEGSTMMTHLLIKNIATLSRTKAISNKASGKYQISRKRNKMEGMVDISMDTRSKVKI